MKKTFKIVLLVIALFLVWYFLFKPSDYTINFTSKSLPGTINQSLKTWSKGLKNASQLKQESSINNISQTFTFSDSIHEYHWTIIPVNDSLSKVSVRIKDADKINSLMNRLKVPFAPTDFTKRSEKTVYEFMTALKDHVDNFKVAIIGEEEMPVKLFAHVTINKAQNEKTLGMMDNFNFISDVLLKNNIELDGLPMVEVLNWDKNTDSLTYNFGFPIKKMDTLPDLGTIQIKRLVPQKGLKAIYNGNYITSDRAWYALIRHAQKNNIKIRETPLEVFHNNPHMGGDAMKWVTEVYLPIDTTATGTP